MHTDTNAKNATDYIKLNTIGNDSTIKQTSRPTYLNLKSQKESYVPTYSNVSTAKMTTRQIATTVYSENTDLIMNNTARKLKSSKKSEQI